MSCDDQDEDKKTLFIGGLSEKVNEKILYELFHQAGPVERVSIPKDKDGRNKTFGFVTYKHLIAIPYALNIFSGTKLFGRELILKNRNVNNSNRNSLFNNQPMSLSRSFTNPLISAICDDMTPQYPQYNMLSQVVQQPFVNLNSQMLQQQLMAMATAQAMQIYGSTNNNADMFPSTRTDSFGSQRSDLVDRNRHHRDEDRNNRSNPYRRSSRSPPRYTRDRSRSPINSRRDERRRDNNERGGYNRWNHRK